MRSRLDVLRLLYSCGYRHAQLTAISYEDGATVVLFTLPAGYRRAAFTAFIRGTETELPQLEVEAGFVVDGGGRRGAYSVR